MGLTPDIVNGCFELGGAAISALSVRELWKARGNFRGVHWGPFVFFTLFAAWNLFFYPVNGLWWSFVGGVALASVNVAWLAVAVGFWFYDSGCGGRFGRPKLVANLDS